MNQSRFGSSTDIHETQHAYYDIFKKCRDSYVEYSSTIDLSNREPFELNQKNLEFFLLRHRNNAYDRARDEILAMVRDKSTIYVAEENLLKKKEEGGLYDYSYFIRQAMLEKYNEASRYTSELKILVTDSIEQTLVVEYEEQIRHSLISLKKIRERYPNVSIDKLVGILHTIPITQWENYYRHTFFPKNPEDTYHDETFRYALEELLNTYPSHIKNRKLTKVEKRERKEDSKHFQQKEKLREEQKLALRRTLKDHIPS
jgi:hypothetical protein